jgi:hypothetical protein
VPGLRERHRRADDEALDEGESHGVDFDSNPLRDAKSRFAVIFTGF